MVKQEGLRLLISSADGRLLSAAPPAMSAVPPSDLKLSSTQVSLPPSTPSSASPVDFCFAVFFFCFLSFPPVCVCVCESVLRRKLTHVRNQSAILKHA